MGRGWFSGKWMDLAKERLSKRNEGKLDTSQYWKERIPNLRKLEKMSIPQVVSVVSGVLYPGVPQNYKEHPEIGQLYKVLTYFRTASFSITSFSIGPNVSGQDVPGYEGDLCYKWGTLFKYEEWDWDDSNEAIQSRYGSPTDRQINPVNKVDIKYNYYGADFDEYPLYMAAKKNMDRALLRALVCDDYMSEELPIRVEAYLKELDRSNKKQDMYRWLVDEIASSDFLSSLSEDDLVNMIQWISTNKWLAERFINLVSDETIWSLFRKPEIYREMVRLAGVKRIMDQ
jgi:hypothetical protein